jgi:o-succinylbenzoate synthase
MQAKFIKYFLHFKRPAGTSRGTLLQKETYFIQLTEGDKTGYGEAALFKGLSADDVPDYEEKLTWALKNLPLSGRELFNELKNYPSILFGLEQAFASLTSEEPSVLFPSDFTRGKISIPINGLVWMGPKDFMFEQIKQKIKENYKVIKLKIGAIDFQDELDLLKYIRSQFSADEVEIRVDANGAFAPSEALEKLKRLSEYDLHSIEQPIRPGQFEEMAKLCAVTPLPIALDEELIGYNFETDKMKILKILKPQYIILKPALHGGFVGSDSWIKAAEELGIGWWITSALESNIGLNAIAQYTAQKQVKIPQGLGTGTLFTNNFDSPLFIKNGSLNYDVSKKMNFPAF